MKQISTVLLFFLLVAACKKEGQEYEFVILCNIPPQFRFFKEATLVVCDKQGNVLETLRVREGTPPELSIRFTISAEKPPEACDIHVILRESNGPVFFNVFSHLDVKNGAFVALDPPSLIPPPASGDQKVIRVRGLESIDSVGFLGLEPVGGTYYDPFEKTALASALLQGKQGALIHIRANGAPDYRYLYIPPDIVNSAAWTWTYDVHWDDFLPVPPAVPLQLPVDQPAVSVYADAFFPDFSGFVSLGPGMHFDPLNPQIIWPAEVPQTLRIAVNGSTYAIEKIFLPGNTLRFDAPDISITSASAIPGRQLQVELQGDVDLVEARCICPAILSWKIHGAPESFRDVRLPDFSEHPDFSSLSVAFQQFEVSAMQFGKHSYDEARAGFPFKSTDLFALARSGYTKVWKKF